MYYSLSSSWRPSEELQAILDKARSARISLFNRSWMANMSIEEAIQEFKKERMYCTNLYERLEGGWNCYLRYETNALLAESGFGETAQEAIFDALNKAKKSGFKNRDLPPVKKPGQGAAGEKSDKELRAYGSPMTAQIPTNLPKTDEELGLTPSESASDAEFDAMDDDPLLGPGPEPADDYADLL